MAALPSENEPDGVLSTTAPKHGPEGPVPAAVGARLSGAMLGAGVADANWFGAPVLDALLGEPVAGDAPVCVHTRMCGPCLAVWAGCFCCPAAP